ncbi:LCP family protein [Spirillospora sp. NPDC029432]|uniref:LCP family protein n=1 Tax=Spirillospora sp. NPDC029432 TaxID=3154599 RepID=UPI0034560B27
MGGGRHARSLRILGVMLAAGLLAAVGVTALAEWRGGTYDRRIQRIPDALPHGSDVRPVEDPGQNWLLIGSDLRGVPAADKWRPGGRARADTIMLLHMPERGGRAYVISIPRDLWVDVPGQEKSKINAAFAAGGSRLLTRTVEDFSGVRIDHVAAVDFAGFKAMTDALGGVEIHLDRPIHDPSNGWSWPAGRNLLDGEEALRFVRERKGLSGSDLDRIERQQAFLTALAEKAADSGTLTSPWKLDAFLRAASGSLAVDSGTEFGTLRSLAARLARIGPERVSFATLPTGGSAWIGDQNVLLPDPEARDGLFEALREGRLDGHLDRHDLETEIDQGD